MTSFIEWSLIKDQIPWIEKVIRNKTANHMSKAERTDVATVKEPESSTIASKRKRKLFNLLPTTLRSIKRFHFFKPGLGVRLDSDAPPHPTYPEKIKPSRFHFIRPRPDARQDPGTPPTPPKPPAPTTNAPKAVTLTKEQEELLEKKEYYCTFTRCSTRKNLSNVKLLLTMYLVLLLHKYTLVAF